MPADVRNVGLFGSTFSSDIAKERADKLKTALDPELDIFTPTFETVSGDQEIAKGIWLFETPGHTAGHYSMMVELKNRRPMLFTADACYSQKSMDMMCIASFHLDPTAGVESLKKLKVLAEKYDAELFYSHDPDSFPNYVKAPGFYS